MVDLIVSILTGAVAVLTVALPLYWKWKKHKTEETDHVEKAADDPRYNEFVEWVRNHVGKKKN